MPGEHSLLLSLRSVQRGGVSEAGLLRQKRIKSQTTEEWIKVYMAEPGFTRVD
jgi:hypothetical protein